MQRSSRLWSAALPRVLASPSNPFKTGKAATDTLRQITSISNLGQPRTVATSDTRRISAKSDIAKNPPVKTAPADKSKTPYSNYTYTSTSTDSRTPKRASSAEKNITAPPASSSTEPVLDPTFPVPQSSAALPDYAALAPPLSELPSSAMPPHSIHLVEAPGFGDSAESLHAQKDWSTSFHGLSSKPFDKEVAQILMRPLEIKDIEIKPGEYNVSLYLSSRL